VSLSDTFAPENIYSFTVKVMPELGSQKIIIPVSSSSNSKEKNKLEVKGSI
jgi:hypothetical protein